MNQFMDINNKKIAIIGLRESGLRSAKLANYLGARVFGSDLSESIDVSNNAMKLMTENHIPTETGIHTSKTCSCSSIGNCCNSYCIETLRCKKR